MNKIMTNIIFYCQIGCGRNGRTEEREMSSHHILQVKSTNDLTCPCCGAEVVWDIVHEWETA